MSYSEARKHVNGHRNSRIADLLGEASAWFTDQWGDVKSMLASFSSDNENQVLAAGYASMPSDARAAPNLRLDYVCGLRREIRKQYISGEGDLCTDVTPFRHGAMSAHAARLSDDLMDQVVQYVERRVKGEVA